MDVFLRELSPVSGSAKNQIVASLTQQLSYEALAYKSQVSVSLLTSIIAEFTPAGVSVDIELTIPYTGLLNTPLGIAPVPNSLEVLVSGNVLAWDSFGALFGFNAASSFAFSTNTFKIGSLVYTQVSPSISNPYTFIAFNPSRQAVLTSNAIDIQGITSVLVNGDYFIAGYPGNQYRVYPLSREFGLGQGSIMKTTAVSLIPTYPASGFQSTSAAFDITQDSVWVGDSVFHFHYYSSGPFTGSYVEQYRMSPDHSTWGLVTRFFLDATSLTFLGFIPNGLKVGLITLKAGVLTGFCWDASPNVAVSMLTLDLTNLSTVLAGASITPSTIQAIVGNSTFTSIVVHSGSYVAWKISGALITISTGGILTFTSALTSDYTDSVAIQVLGDDAGGVYYKTAANLIYKGASTMTIASGASIPRLAQIGSVDYTQDILQVTDGSTLTGGSITFSVAEALSRLDDSKFPVINNITWNA